MWVGTEGGVAMYDHGVWHRFDGPKFQMRSAAEDPGGRSFLGSIDGRVFEARDGKLQPAEAPPGLLPSGSFFVEDLSDDSLWLANRGFVGRLENGKWVRRGPAGELPGGMLAAAAQGGGLWTYSGGELRRVRADGTSQLYRVPVLSDPRTMIQDRSGAVWIASVSSGLLKVLPGVSSTAITASNGLAHNAVRALAEDREGNLWVGTSNGGLHRLRRRQFRNIGMKEGLPDHLVRVVTETTPGRIAVGTHGGGIAMIEFDTVAWARPRAADKAGQFAWSLLYDRAGRLWMGTYGNGLLMSEGGAERSVPMASSLGKAVYSLYQDSLGRVLVGAVNGLGVVTGDHVVAWPESSPLAGASVRSIVEEPVGGVLWVGTFQRGLYRIGKDGHSRFGKETGLPGERISSLALDDDGCVWAGVFDHGMVCIHGSPRVVTLIGNGQGLPADTIGSILDDGNGWFWMGSNKGILRVSKQELHQVANGAASRAAFNLFDESDGLGSVYCSEGYQPAAVRDKMGTLWFATLKGVTGVRPAGFVINTNPPPVLVESLAFTDQAGQSQVLRRLNPSRIESLPPGSIKIEFGLAALSLAAPDKVHFAYKLDGDLSNPSWADIGARRALYFHTLSPGSYTLRVKAANNDGIWNETGASFSFVVEPFLWQTLWFRVLLSLALAAACSAAAWTVTNQRLRTRIQQLEQQRAFEEERARLASVMEATSDLVAFADRTGRVLHLNPSGRKLLGIGPAEDVRGLNLASFLSAGAAEKVSSEAIPVARERGTWEGETSLVSRTGREIPVSQVIIAHRDESGDVGFLSTVARDISERKSAETERGRLQSELQQAQKMEMVGRLAGGVAHDFNNMLQVILGNVALALEETRAGTELHSSLVEVQRSAKRSAELTHQLLAFARKQAISPKVLDLNRTISGMLKMLQRLIGENIRLRWSPGAQLWPVRIDPTQIDQILANLAVNARDAIRGEGSVSIGTANGVLDADAVRSFAGCAPGEYTMLFVEDSGQGMSKEVLEHLFEPFFTTKELGKGTGLGLATVFGIVNQNHGVILVDSQPGKGSRFRVCLPRVEGLAPDTLAEVVQDAPPRGTETILLVEDEIQILDLGRKMLQQCGYKVLAASTPELAISLVVKHIGAVDLLVTDVIMPGMNGRELQYRLAAIKPGLKCLFMSGYTAEAIGEHGVLEPGVQFLQKPFTLNALTHKVRNVLDARKGTTAEPV